MESFLSSIINLWFATAAAVLQVPLLRFLLVSSLWWVLVAAFICFMRLSRRFS